MSRIFLLIFIICFVSCEQNPSKLEIALDLADENRIELEKVLKRYSANPDDSLKYKAACFLIENMPQYYYFEGTQLDNYSEYYRCLSECRGTEPQDILDSITQKYGSFSLADLTIKYDIEEIDSAYLCDNIEWSFKVWEEQPWSESVSFGDFCEYILPYRIGTEKLTLWKEKLYNDFNGVFGNIDRIPEIDNPITAARILTDSIRKKGFRFTTIAPADYPNLGSNTSSFLSGSCRDITDFTIYVCRALGIPCHLDFLPLRGDENNDHLWVSYNDKDGTLHVQDFLEHIVPVRSSHLREFNKLKVYRKTFSKNETDFKILYTSKDSVYPFFQEHNFTDVTVFYADCFTQSIKIPHSFFYSEKSKSNIFYLCLADRMQWTPITWGEYRENILEFENISKGSVVRVATWDGKKLIFQTPPFLITSPKGELVLFSETSDPSNIVLFSKTNLKNDEDFLKRMVHGVFEGSDTPDFKEKDTLFHIVHKPYRLQTNVRVNNGQKYRYIRYFGPKDGFCNLSEIAFFENVVDTISLKGEIIGTSGSFLNSKKHEHTNAFDGKTDTSFDYKDSYGGWVGLDLGEPKRISRIVYTPRNRDNFVRMGDTYELFYSTSRGWMSLGSQIANSDSLLYSGVPRDALFYLRNQTRGVEERIFSMKNGKQKYW